MERSARDIQLLDVLSSRLEQATADGLVATLARMGLTVPVLELFSELRDISTKVAHEAIDALPEFQRRCGLEAIVGWLDVGISLAESSGATGLKYFKESPLLLGVLDSATHRTHVLTLTLKMADGHSPLAPNCAFEFFRKAPELLLVVPSSALQIWGEVGLELAEWDYVLGVEFFRESPSIAQVISPDSVRAWVGFGMKLITQNSLGKTDYVGTLEFFRTSPAIFGDLPQADLQTWVIDVGATLAEHSPQVAVSFLAESPTILRSIPSSLWRLQVLKYGLLIAERDAEATLEYLRRCPEILRVGGESPETETAFESWFRGGMEILEYSAEGARAYFALETRNALASVAQAMSGVPLRQIARSLKLFAKGLCGIDVTIESLPDAPDDSGGHHAGVMNPGASEKERLRARVSPDGQTIFLPALLRCYPTREENLRFFTVMTAHEAGHLEFGTYRVALDQLQDLARAVHARYGQLPEASAVERISTLADLFTLYPQRGVIRDLWTVLEDARVDYRLQYEYPGLRDDLAALARESVKIRSVTHGMTAREMVVDCLLQRLTAEPGATHSPDELHDVVDWAWAASQSLLHPGASAEDAIRLADHLYQVLDEMIGSLVVSERNDRTDQQSGSSESDLGAGPKASEEVATQYRPITNLAYRGAMDPDMVQGQNPAGGQMDETAGHAEGRTTSDPFESGSSGLSEHGVEEEVGRHPTSDGLAPQVISPSAIEQWLTVREPKGGPLQSTQSDGRAFLYDEWDGVLHDYRSRWCRVIERSGIEGSPDFAEATLAAHAPTVRLLRRYFESIRPTALRRVYGQEDGEEVDLDAALRHVVDRRVGADLFDRVYVRRERRERQVAAAFLVDMSGSTGQHIETGTRSVIDVEKEGLVLLSEALEVLGDQYAIYGYSGQGRNHVDFVVLKEFDDGSRGRVAQRIGAVTPLQQNRDGAAIRHAVWKLVSQAARHRLLVLISDGKPLDDGYTDEYSLEDTKMALREARMQGVTPFCITVDRDANDYLKRMYGDVNFLILDDAGTLPDRLPRIYQSLTT